MFKYITRAQLYNSFFRQQPLTLLKYSQQGFATGGPGGVILDPSKNKYQESQMLFFNDPNPQKKKTIVKPKTIREIKKLQTFVKQYKTDPGKSLNESIKSMAKRDESFNEFLKNFKAKNEQNWANIIDLSQEEQEAKLLEKSPDYRKNEMVMMEEFRRRKNLERFYDLMKKHKIQEEDEKGKKSPFLDVNEEAMIANTSQKFSGPERFFQKGDEEIFNPKDFTLIFIESDSVTNVTALNRVNHRRVLLFIGNGNGLISYGLGKGDDYEAAFEGAYKKLRQNLVCLPLSEYFTCPQVLQARHNDFRIKIWPQEQPNYWGHPVIWKMLLYTGFYHCRFSIKSRKKDNYSMIYAYFQAVTQNRSLDDLAQLQGRKLKQVSFGNPTQNTFAAMGQLQ